MGDEAAMTVLTETVRSGDCVGDGKQAVARLPLSEREARAGLREHVTAPRFRAERPLRNRGVGLRQVKWAQQLETFCGQFAKDVPPPRIDVLRKISLKKEK